VSGERAREREIRWRVAEGDGACVGDVVARAGGDARAIEDGRVFVGRRRVRDAHEAVSVGDEVSIAPPRDGAVAIAVLAKTADVIAVAKPAGIPTIADHAGEAHALVAVTAREAGVDAASLHPTSRLDRDVSGVVVFARTPRAAERIARARTEGAYSRLYVAIAARAPAESEGEWNAPIGRAKDPRHREARGRDAVHALTKYRVVATAKGAALLALAPTTGRTHQLRVHCADAGAPLLGDRTYGGPTRLTLPSGKVFPLARIALHCARVAVLDLDLAAPIPDDLTAIWSALGGEAEAWNRAASCLLG
jgi:23S rRNA-/tRNA-specific pseudouridylate synthase